jgi:outer membrane protein assembly factor BamE (lipoprotein component of BamABCDE complex)
VSKALCFALMVVLLAGCATTPSTKIVNLALGMTQDEVKQVMGTPFAVRASKMYDGGGSAQVWEYIPPVFSRAAFSDKYDKTYWVYLENGKVVQWGEPGDFSGSETVGNVAVRDYTNKKGVK